MAGKNIKEWAKELKHNEKFAKKYEGLTTVEGILATAKKDGYNIKKEELMELDLDSVAGGFGINTEMTGLKVNTNVVTLKNQKVGMNLAGRSENNGNITMS